LLVVLEVTVDIRALKLCPAVTLS